MKTTTAAVESLGNASRIFRVQFPSAKVLQVGENTVEIHIPVSQEVPVIDCGKLTEVTKGLSNLEYDALLARLEHMVNIEILRANIRIL